MAALDMTGEQKEKFKAINKETTPERDKMIADVYTEVEKMFKKGELNFNGFVASLAAFKGYSKELKQRRSEVLTESQIAKVRTLSKLPRFLSIANLLPQWMPSANSWKPGDPLPAGVVPPQPVRARFPRSE
jgi:hypothetical protein